MFKELLLCLLSCLVLTNCSSKKNTGAPASSHQPAKVIVPGPEGLPKALWQDISQFPSHTLTISAYSKEFMPLIKWAGGLQGLPACVAPILAKVDRYYSVAGANPDGSQRTGSQTQVFYGTFSQSETAACLAKAAKLIFPEAQIKTRDGVTQMTNNGSSTSIRWVEIGDSTIAYYDDDRAYLLDNFPSNKSLLPTGPLTAMVTNVDRTRDTWTVGLTDLGSSGLGFKSTGYDVSMSSPEGDSIAGTASLFLTSSDEAYQAAEKIRGHMEGAKDEGTREILRQVVTVSVEAERVVLSFSADLSQFMVLVQHAAELVQAP